MLYSEEDLLKLLNNAGLTALKCDFYKDANRVDLETDDIKVIIDYAKANQIKHIFYCYEYMDEDDYILDEDELILTLPKDPLTHPLDYEEYADDFLKLAQKDIANYKSSVRSIDFNKPIRLVIICVHNGMMITIHTMESQAKKLQLPEMFIKSLYSKYYATLTQRRAARWLEIQSQKETILKELKDTILSDSEFAKCTSHSKRLSYIKDLLNRPESQRFRKVFSSEIGNVIWYDASNFVDKLYSEIKNKNM